MKINARLLRLFLFLSIVLISLSAHAQLSSETIAKITYEINDLRTTGVTCGNEYLAPVGTMAWHDDLYKVSEGYAEYMHSHEHFNHISIEGQDAGDRLDGVGYDWKYVGENLAVGQRDFYEVLADWIKSESHCKMLMNPHMEHFAVARHKNYWVQTFATHQEGRNSSH